MPLPLAAALGVGAGMSAAQGLANYVGKKDADEEAKKAALRQLKNKYAAGSPYSLVEEPKETASVFADIAMPVGSSVIGGLGKSWVDDQSKDDKKKG